MLSGSILAQAVTLLSMPLITRLFSLEDMGKISVFINFVTIQSALAVFKFENVLLLYEDLEDAKPLWAVFFWSMLIVSLFSLVIFFGFHYSALLGVNELPLWTSFFIVLFVLGSGISIIVKTLLVRERDFHMLSQTIVLKNIFNVIIRIIGGFLSGGLLALITAEILCLFAFIIQFFKKQIKQIIVSVNQLKRTDIINTVKKWKRFPLLESPSILFDQLNAVLPLLLIAQELGPALAGLFALSYRITFLPGTHMGSTLSEVFRGQFSELYRKLKFKEVKAFFKSNIKKVFLLTLVFYIPLYLFVPGIIPFVFGNKWSGSAELVKYLVPWAASSFVVSTLSSVFSIMQVQYLKLIYDGSALILLFTFLYFIPSHSIENYTKAISLSNVLANIIYFILIITSYRKLSKCAALQV